MSGLKRGTGQPNLSRETQLSGANADREKCVSHVELADHDQD